MHTHDREALREVVRAAEAVLAAREDQMLTSEEWDALEHAVAEATQPPANEREETFTVQEDILTRSVMPAPGRGDPYQHTCDLAQFCHPFVQSICVHRIDDPDAGRRQKRMTRSLSSFVWMRDPAEPATPVAYFPEDRPLLGVVISHVEG